MASVIAIILFPLYNDPENLEGRQTENQTKINKIVFNKDELGNYVVTVGKVDRMTLSEKINTVVAVGVAPTITALRKPESLGSTRLNPSQSTVNDIIHQTKDLSNHIQKMVEPKNQQEKMTENLTAEEMYNILQNFSKIESSRWNLTDEEKTSVFHLIGITTRKIWRVVKQT